MFPKGTEAGPRSQNGNQTSQLDEFLTNTRKAADTKGRSPSWTVVGLAQPRRAIQAADHMSEKRGPAADPVEKVLKPAPDHPIVAT